MVGNRKWAGFLFNWSSHYQIYVVQYFLTNTVVWKSRRDRCPGKRNVHFQFPSVAQNDLCLSSLLTSFTWELAGKDNNGLNNWGSRVDTLVRALAYQYCGLKSILTTTPYMAWVCWFSAPRGFSPVYLRSSIESWETVAKKKYHILVKDLINSKFSNAYNHISISNISTGVVFPLQHGVTTC